jgi:hypothetical protein
MSGGGQPQLLTTLQSLGVKAGSAVLGVKVQWQGPGASLAASSLGTEFLALAGWAGNTPSLPPAAFSLPSQAYLQLHFLFLPLFISLPYSGTSEKLENEKIILKDYEKAREQ